MMAILPLYLKPDDLSWAPGSPLLGDSSLYEGQETVFIKRLSDRREQGEGVAQIIRFCPPLGMLIKVLAIAGSDEHIYILSGGHCDKSGRQKQFPGYYMLHPRGHRHGAMLAVETTALVVYTGEPDELIDFQIVRVGGGRQEAQTV